MDNKEQFDDSFFDNTKEYLQTQLSLLKLETIEKLSRTITVILLLMLVVILLAGSLFYLSFGFIWWSKDIFGNGDVLPGILMVSGFYLLLLFAIFLLRRRLIINPMIRFFSAIFFTNITEEDNEEE